MTDNLLHWYHRLYVGIQYLLPQHLLSASMLRATRVRWQPFKELLIRTFIRHFKVDMTEAEQSDPTAYASFNEFFTRSLRPGARPIAPQQDAVACPADGALSQLGSIYGGRILQVKGHDYSLLDLLGGRKDLAQHFDGGAFATIYLSPRDYHRVHMPFGGTLREMIHIPGRLFSVNAVTAALVPRLFSRNERVLCLFDTELGPIALILVGAIFVGCIETVWTGQVTPTGGRKSNYVYDGKTAIYLQKGAEMGRFNMGSTVILLCGPAKVDWNPELKPADSLRLGQRLGKICNSTPTG